MAEVVGRQSRVREKWLRWVGEGQRHGGVGTETPEKNL